MRLSEPSPPRPCLALGADAGGSKVRILLRDAEGIHTREWPSANLRRIPLPEAVDLLAAALQQSLQGRTWAPDAVCCIGAAGAGTAAVADPLRTGLQERLGLRSGQMIVTSDAHIAHRAVFGARPGVLVIAGTGSGCYAVDPQGSLLRSGGWGPGLGDPGSGTALGKSAIKAVLSALEAGSLTPLAEDVMSAMGLVHPTVPDVLDRFYGGDFAPADLAPVVLDRAEAEDPEAIDLARAQVQALAAQAHRLATSMSPGPESVAIVGGLTDRPSYARLLSEALTRQLSGLPVATSPRSPAEGALQWAEEERKRLSH